MTAAHAMARGAAPEWGGAAAGRPNTMNTDHRYTNHRHYGRLLLWLGIAMAVAGAWWLLFADDSPVRVLSCVWERSSADATATTSAACTQVGPGG